MKHKAFIKNAVILTVTSLILRTVGIFFRIWMSNTIGAEGIGLYQLIFSVYVLASTFATTGITTAVTRMVSELPTPGSAAKKILLRAVLLSLIIAFVTLVTLFFSADFIARRLLCDERATLSIQILGFSLPFMGVSSCLRGYFIAVRNTASPSVGQLFEQLIRMVLIVFLVSRYAALGLAATSAAVLAGDTAAEAFGCILLYILYKLERRKYKRTPKTPYPVTRKLLHIAVPITAGRYIHTILRTCENLLVPARLSLFTSAKSHALEQFGRLKGMAMPILFFPASFLTAFSTLMIPEISESLACGKVGRVRVATQKSIGITVLISTLLGGIFLLCGEDLSEVLYHERETGFLIKALAPLVPLMYLESVCDGILKGLDQQGYSFAYGVVDSVSRIVLIWFLVPGYGMKGFLLIMVYSNLLTSLLNVRRLLKVTETPIKIKSWVLIPLISAASGVTAGYFCMRAFDGALLRLAVGSGVTAAVYIAFMLLLGELAVFNDLY